MSELNEDDAWRLALSWQQQLQGRVHLVPSTDSGRVIENYEWVSLKTTFEATFPNSRRESVSALDMYTFRAACTAWFALSCCRGYAGRENPTFWKRVFGKLREPRLPASQRDEPYGSTSDEYSHLVRDCVRFFDDKDTVFPRVKLVADIALLRDFINGPEEKTPEMEVVDDRLATILLEVRPYVCWALTKRCIPVSLGSTLLQPGRTQFSRDLLDMLPTDRRAANSQSTTDMNTCFEVTEISRPRGCNGIGPNLDEMRMFFINHAIHVDEYHFDVPEPRTKPGPYIELLMRTNPLVQACVKRVSYRLHDKGDPFFEAFCSALPVAPSLEFFRLITYSRMLMSEIHWAWLGYALFQPDGGMSPWSALELDGSCPSVEQANALRCMSTGNNLLAIRTGERPRNTAYHQAELRDGSVIHVEPRSGSEVLVNGCQYVEACFYTCDVSLASLPEWIAVVIPSCGLGWTHSSNVVDIVARQPTLCKLKTLCFKSPKHPCDQLTPLLSVVGSNLERLDMGEMDSVNSNTLESILQHCPMLKCLRVCHDGSYWAKRKQSLQYPQLEELSLKLLQWTKQKVYLAPSNSALRASLSHLYALRIEGSYPYSFFKNRKAIINTLRRHPRLRFVDFTCRSAAGDRRYEPLTYEEGRTFSWDRLGCDSDLVSHGVRCNPLQLCLTGFGSIFSRSTRADGKTLARQHSFNHKTYLGFLSVVQSSQTRSSMCQRLSLDTLKIIFQFAWVPPREIWIESDGKQVKWRRIHQEYFAD